MSSPLAVPEESKVCSSGLLLGRLTSSSSMMVSTGPADAVPGTTKAAVSREFGGEGLGPDLLLLLLLLPPTPPLPLPLLVLLLRAGSMLAETEIDPPIGGTCGSWQIGESRCIAAVRRGW